MGLWTIEIRFGMIYHDSVDEEEGVYGDTSRRCGHYEVGLSTRQG